MTDIDTSLRVYARFRDRDAVARSLREGMCLPSALPAVPFQRTFVFRAEVRARGIQKIGRRARVYCCPGESALQMNDQLESAHVGGVDSRGRAERLQ